MFCPPDSLIIKKKKTCLQFSMEITNTSIFRWWPQCANNVDSTYNIKPNTTWHSLGAYSAQGTKPNSVQLLSPVFFFLEENRQTTLKSQQDPFDPPPRVMKIKTKINKWDQIKHKSFCTMKETKPVFSFFSFILIFSSSLLSAIRVISSAYLRLLISPGNFDSSLWFIQPGISHYVLCI